MDKELIDALKFALNFEITGEKTYRQIAEESKDAFVKNTFNGLAGDEVIHEQVIRKYIDSLEKGKKLNINKEMEKIKNIDPKRFFGMLAADFRKKAAFDAEKLVPFDTGIALEKRGIGYYTNQLNIAKSEETKKFFKFLLIQENFHLISLTEAKKLLSDPVNFYVEFEKWTLEG